jgi:hypothetical protein
MSNRTTSTQPRNNEADRLAAKTRFTHHGCWDFTGYIDPDGYGRIYWRGRNGYPAHRAAYELAYGPIPPGLTIDHTCNNTRCIRYEHLEAVTQAENTRRAVERRTHCRSGHQYTDATTYWFRGLRHCRPCNALAARRYALRKRSGSSNSTGRPVLSRPRSAEQRDPRSPEAEGVASSRKRKHAFQNQ